MTCAAPHRREAQRLRRVVDCLPYETRVAMLDGMRRYDRIIVGAYTDRTGGVCPMLAAHRCGGRTDFRSFARAWDRFTGAGKRARKATERELRTLTAQLEASIWAEDERRVADAAAPTSPAPRRSRTAQRGSARSGAGTATATPCAARWARSATPDARAREREHRRRLAIARSKARPPTVRSAGRIIITSGIMQAGESRSRQRTTSATSSGRIMSACATWPLIHSVIARVDEAGADRRAAHAVVRELLGRRLGERDHARLRRRVGGEPALRAACPRSRRCSRSSRRRSAPASFSIGIASRVTR